MKTARLSIGLPLLAKELVEQSARRRTYVVRVLYAVLFFVSAFVAFYDILGNRQGDLLSVLGQGRRMFEFLVMIQFLGIYLFMPALSCGVLTTEKERNSLGLLFLTRLSPSAIIFEKLLSRMIPMLSFLLLSMPLLAFAYSLGGITATYLWSGVWILALTMLQMCSLAVMCSAFFRGTVGAFIGTYLLGLCLLFTLPVAEELGLTRFYSHHYSNWGGYGTHEARASFVVEVLKALGIIGDGRQDVLFVFFGPYIFLEHANRSVSFGSVVLRTIPMMFSCAAFLLLARVFVVRRAFVPARNYLLGAFRAIDRLFTRMNQNRVTKGIVLIRENTALPGYEPVAWRETTKKSLGTVRYLFRVLVATEVPVAVACLLVLGISYDASSLEGISVMLCCLWCLAVLLVSVKATSLVSGERTHQTLDVLLTTPLSARDIVMQKFRGVRRLMLVLAVPFLTLILFETAWRAEFSGASGYVYYAYRDMGGTLLYLTASLLSLAIYLPMVAWLSFLVGMYIRSQGRAIIASLAIIVGWCVAPIVLLVMIDEFLLRGIFSLNSRFRFSFLLLSSPAMMVPLAEFGGFREIARSEGGAWLVVLFNFAFYGVCLFAFRYLCLSRANQLLGRADERPQPLLPRRAAAREPATWLEFPEDAAT